jgi:Ribbon-helix-helix protein, copG family.
MMTASKVARTTRTTFTVDTDDMVELEAIAAQQRVSVAWVIRDCIKEYLAGKAPLLADQRRPNQGRGDSR